MKKLLIITVSFVALALTGCLKDQFGTDVYSAGIKPIIEFEYPQGGNNSGLGSGLEFFANCALTYPATDVSDTATFIVNIASTNTLNKAISITVGPDANALLDNYSTDSIKYVAMPDSIYTIVKPTQSIAAGQRQATFQVVFYPDKIDPSQNFMLPMTITSASGYTVSGNFGHIYFHTIGNPFAGAYLWDYERWNAADSTSTPIDAAFYGQPTVLAPDNPTQFEVPSGYYYQPRYVVDFVNTAGIYSDFTVAFNASDLAYNINASGGVLGFSSVNILTADPINKRFAFQYLVTNSSNGAHRYIIDRYYKP